MGGELQGTISRVDSRSGVTLTKITVGGRPWNVKVSALTGRVYATDELGGALTVIDGTTVIASIPVGIAPHGVILDLAKSLAFVAVTGSNQIAIVDLLTNQVLQTVPVGLQPTSVSQDRLTGKVYSANQGDGTISVLTPQ